MPKIRAFDIEADELLLKATKVWCMVVQDIETKEIWKFGPDQIQQGIDLLMSSDMIVAHNGVMYDVPVLERLYGCKLPKCLDTLLVSRLVFPDKFFHPLGGNSLEDWGIFLKRHKKKYEGGFAAFTQEMLDYCVGDVELLTDIYQWQRKHAFKFKQAIRIEHDVAKIICQQIQNGFTLDIPKAQALKETLRAASESAASVIDKIVLPTYETKHFIECWKAGEYKFNTCKEALAFGFKRKEIEKVMGSEVIEHKLNTNSGTQIVEAMEKLYGWKPTVFKKDTGNPVMDADVLEEIDNPLAKAITEARVLKKRAEFVESWLEFVMENGRVHGSVITNGAPTGRMGHSDPNMAQIPKSGKPWGHECRDCWKARDGWVLVGADASGLELRMLAHEMWKYDGGAYAKVILESDVHVENQKAAGLSSRDQAKTFIYALIYGAWDTKIGAIVGGSTKQGKKLRDSFKAKLPAYAKVLDDILAEYKKNNKVIYGMDGRPLPVRAEYAALNTKLQSHGAVLMKQALICFHESAQALYAGRYAYCANVHDEFQIECEPKIAHDLGKLMVSSITKAGVVLGIKIRLDGEYKVGKTWAETH